MEIETFAFDNNWLIYELPLELLVGPLVLDEGTDLRIFFEGKDKSSATQVMDKDGSMLSSRSRFPGNWL